MKTRTQIESQDQASTLAKSNLQFSITKLDLILLAAMVMGITGKNLWDTINRTGKIQIDLTSMIGALVLAPIIYLAASSNLSGQKSLSLPSLFLAFQYGFFWQSVFETAQKSMG